MSHDEPQNRTAIGGKGLWRIMALLAVIAIIGFGWNWAWQAASTKLESVANSRISKWSDKGTEITCANRSIIGYPFRIGFHCDRLSVFSTTNQLKLDAGEFRSAAQFYKPGHAIAELDGPLNAETLAGGKVSGNWDNLKASLVVGIGGWKRISLEARSVTGNGILADANPIGMYADDFQLHARMPEEQSRANGLDIAASAANLNLDGLQKVPALDLVINLGLQQIGAEARPGFNLGKYLRQHGLSGEAREVAIMPKAGGRLAFAGPFEISAEGLLSGRLTVEITDTARLLAFAASAGGNEGWLAQAGQIISMIPQSSDAGARRITLNIQDGVVSAGFFKLGEIPRLF